MLIMVDILTNATYTRSSRCRLGDAVTTIRNMPGTTGFFMRGGNL